eukprot:s2902_g7.t1
MDHCTSVPNLGAGPGCVGLEEEGSDSTVSSPVAPTGSIRALPPRSSVTEVIAPISPRRRPRARPTAVLDRAESPEEDGWPTEYGHRIFVLLTFGSKFEHYLSSLSFQESAGLPWAGSSARRSLRATEEPQIGPPTPSQPSVSRKPRQLALSGSLMSLRSMSEHSIPCPECPESPSPAREDFKTPPRGIAVVFFDFDGTLTATPGDRAARRTKQVELCERAAMLEPRLRGLRADGASLGIISKSTEEQASSTNCASGLLKFFDAPLVAKAVGFEGKAGFIEDLALKGCLPRLGSTRGHGVPFSRILLVDDDVLELERAKARGLQVYAAPADGGLQEEERAQRLSDFDIISEALHVPRPRSHPQRATMTPQRLVMAPPLVMRTPSSAPSFGCRRSSVRRHGRKSFKEDQPLRLPSFNDFGRGGRWRNVILFSGDCFEG